MNYKHFQKNNTKNEELEISIIKGNFQLAVAGTNNKTKFLISVKEIPSQREEILNSLAG